MLKRYLILLGAQTTAGGTVKTATSFMSYNGLPYALEGDLVDCPACGQQGSIECVAPRLAARYNGKQYALEHDLCVCGCSPPPRLIANQQHHCQVLDDTASDGNALDAVLAHTQASAGKRDAAPLQLIRASDDQPFRNRHYVLELPGRKIEGRTDADGQTRPLSSEERDTLIAWHVEGDAGAGA
jgi:uncharacterized Zn-binding protein involved in type VI secretion